jgi:hypothetical protein
MCLLLIILYSFLLSMAFMFTSSFSLMRLFRCVFRKIAFEINNVARVMRSRWGMVLGWNSCRGNVVLQFSEMLGNVQ